MDVGGWTHLNSMIGRGACEAAEKEISRFLEVFRYRMVRHYCRGRVVDAACGSGYGSWMVSLNPAVTSVLGLDADPQAVAFATREFGHVAGVAPQPPHARPCRFGVADLDSEEVCPAFRECDTVLSVETIEHLRDPRQFLGRALRGAASRLVLTFPSYETTAYNPHHLHDLQGQEVARWVLSERPRATVVKWLNAFDDFHLVVWDLSGGSDGG